MVKPRGEKAYADVARRIRELIAGDTLAIGTRLPSERDLATRLGSSRPTVREALAALELAGIIDTRVGAGSFVRDPRPDDAALALAHDASPAETIATRLLLEPPIAELAAQNRSAGHLRAMRRPLEKLEGAAARGSSEHPVDLDLRFHEAIAVASGNAMLTSIVSPIWTAMRESLWLLLKERTWGARDTVLVAADHRRIYDAIAERDPRRARFEMERHLRRVDDELFAASESDPE